MQQELLTNPDMLRQVLDNPLVQQMMNDPENMRTLITSNPQMQDLMAVCLHCVNLFTKDRSEIDILKKSFIVY